MATDAGKGAKKDKGAKGAKAQDKGKKKGAGKGEKGEKGELAQAAAAAPSVAAHPRAARAVARTKSWGGLLGFALGGYLSLPTNTFADAMLRALMAGVVGYVAVWAGAVFLWRRLVMLEMRSREHQLASAASGASAGRELPPAAPAAARPAGRPAS